MRTAGMRAGRGDDGGRFSRRAGAADAACRARRGSGRGQSFPPPSRGGGGGGGAAGPADKPLVDFALADKGKDVWVAECVTCHGAQARGTDNGPNLLRSLVFLRDRYGSEIGPFLKKGHPLQSGKPASSLTDEQITNIAHFLRKQLNDTLRGAAVFTVQDIRTGDAKAGAEYFNGAGKCTTCHSATGDLAGLAGKYETVDIQQRMLFPGGGRGGRRGGPPPKSAVRVTVTPQGGRHGFRRARLHGRLRRDAAGRDRCVAHVQANAGAQGAEDRSARRASRAARYDHRQEAFTTSSRTWRH